MDTSDAWEEVVAWFVGRSVVVIVLAFVLGLVVGWLWWRRRKVQFGESHTIARLTRTHQARTDQLSAALARKDGELRARDDEIARLRAEAEVAASASAASSTGAAGAATGVGVSSGSATWLRLLDRRHPLPPLNRRRPQSS